jgi:hypothetical protein
VTCYHRPFRARPAAAAGIVSSLVLVASCAEPVPDAPTWVEHVRPIVQANCTRCHGSPSQGGAPSSFRLDKYDSTDLPDGRVIRGARDMAWYVAARAAARGDMPPDYPRGDAARDILEKWAPALPGEPGELGELAGNRAPEAHLRTALPAEVDADPVVVDYEITDADGHLVDGSLWARAGDNEIVLSTDLRSGRGTVQWDPSVLAADNYELTARLTDDLSTVDRVLATVAVAHASGNTAPTAAFVAPEPYLSAIIADVDSGYEITVAVSDPDMGDTHTVDFVAVRGDEQVVIAQGVAVSGGQASTPWPTTAVPAGDTWRLQATVSDGQVATTIVSDRVIISHSTTGLAFADVQQMLGGCGYCHYTADVAFTDHAVFDRYRALIYRRVVQERTMPPPSAEVLDPTFPMPTERQRALLAEYILGGAPP